LLAWQRLPGIFALQTLLKLGTGLLSDTQQPVGQSSRQLANKDSPLKSFLGGRALS
jgi:hypothetical protein